MRAALIVTLCAAAFAVAWSAEAGKKSVEKEAKGAFQAGIQAFQVGRYEEAVQSFRHANDLKPSWKLLFNIGQCEAALKHYGLALDAFEDYLAQAGDEIATERQQEVIAEIKRLREMVGYLELTGREGDLVVVDGVERGFLPLRSKLRLVVGEARVEVRRDGEVVFDDVVDIQGTQTTELATERVEEPADPVSPVRNEPPPPSKHDEKDGGKVGAWVGFGIAGAAVVGAAITGGVALNARSKVDEACAGTVCPISARSDEDRAFALAVTTDVLIGVAAVGAITGIVLLISGGREEVAGEARLTPIWSGDAAGVALSGRF